MSSIETRDLLDLTHTLAVPFLRDCRYPWQAFPQISGWIRELGAALSAEEYEQRGEDVWVARSAKVAPTAFIAGPAIIGPGTEVRHCAFIRGSALVGADCVVGNSTELKNVILFDKVQVPHYNYVGDSILGYRSHMGAGSITSNVKSDKTLVAVRSKDEILETGLKKVRRRSGRFGRGWLQFGFEPRYGYRARQHGVSAFNGARGDTAEQHLQMCRRNCSKEIEVF